MTKTQVQRNREHIARIRRKARAFDMLSNELKVIANTVIDDDSAKTIVTHAIERAERQAGE